MNADKTNQACLSAFICVHRRPQTFLSQLHTVEALAHVLLRYCRAPPPLKCETIELWLRHRRKVARHEAIAEFAAEHAGSHWDLDTDLEIASTEHLIATHEARR